MTDLTARPILIDLGNLGEAKKIIKSIQRDCRATLRLLAVLESLDKENDNATEWSGTKD